MRDREVERKKKRREEKRREDSVCVRERQRQRETERQRDREKTVSNHTTKTINNTRLTESIVSLINAPYSTASATKRGQFCSTAA